MAFQSLYCIIYGLYFILFQFAVGCCCVCCGTTHRCVSRNVGKKGTGKKGTGKMGTEKRAQEKWKKWKNGNFSLLLVVVVCVVVLLIDVF